MNKAFQEQTGLAAKDLIGKTVKTVIPGIEDIWIQKYDQVCKTKNVMTFTQESSGLGRTYYVTAYPLSHTEFTALFLDISDQIIINKQLNYLYTHDSLTGLLNRQVLYQHINQYDDDNRFPYVLVIFDINGLSLFNEAFGYDVGDMILKKVALMSEKVVHEFGTVYRTGDDEFAILIKISNNGHNKELLLELKKEIEQIEYRGMNVSITYAFGQRKDASVNYERFIRSIENDLDMNKVYYTQSHLSHSVNALLSMLINKYEEEKRHSNVVSEYCVAIGEKLKLDVNSLAQLRLLGSIHDIGKIGIPDSILRKPGKLNDEEYEVMKTHADIGFNILNSTLEFKNIALVVLHHHERWDGNGYPMKLKGDKIPLFSRIIAVADAYEAMTSDRVYRARLSKEDAIAELIRCKGSQFDPALVDIFLEILKTQN